MSIFGFPTAPSGSGGFAPIVKYDARSGRIFRMDRIEKNGNFESEAVDITHSFKAVVDFENMQTGWIRFTPGSAPEFIMVRIGEALPDRPSANHKNGVRVEIKLSKDCGGDKPVREIAGTSRAFLSGLEPVYAEYEAEKGQVPGQVAYRHLGKDDARQNWHGRKIFDQLSPDI